MRCLFVTIYAVIIVIVSASATFAVIIDSCNGNSSLNNLGYSWYFYDDSHSGGTSTIPGVLKDSNGKYVVLPTANAGHDKGGIALPFSLGQTKTGPLSSHRYVGMGTKLCADGNTLDLTSATAVTFWLKADKPVVVDFKVIDTVTIKDSAFYHHGCAVNSVWQQYTVSLSTGLGGLNQPVTQNSAPFSLKNISKLEWEINDNSNSGTVQGTIIIDDIILVNWGFWNDMCASCVGNPGHGLGYGNILLSNFDHPPYLLNSRGYYWYCFNDGPNRIPAVTSLTQFSAITGGATPDPSDPLVSPVLSVSPKGYNGTQCANIQFTLGPPFNKVAGDGNIIKSFVGIRTYLWSDKTSSNAYNATADNVTGIYFDYMLATNAPAYSPSVLRMEVTANAFTIDRVVHYINVPATSAGVWKSATIFFGKLVLPHWDGVSVDQPLDATQLKKIQWTVQDAQGIAGELAIDNVYFLSSDGIVSAKTDQGTIKRNDNNLKIMSGFSTSLTNNNLKVSLAKEMSNASITLVNTQGSVVKNISGVSQAAQMNVSGLARGVYMLNVKANLKSGAAFNQTTAVTLY